MAERIVRIGAAARRLLSHPRSYDALLQWPDLRGSPFTDVSISGVLGTGRRCMAFAATYRGQPVALKIYHPQSVVKHARCNGGSLARYEYERNVALRGIAHLALHVAEPIAWLSSSRFELFIQERVFGEPIDAFLRTCSVTARAFVLGEVRAIVERAHDAGLFDLDLDPSNVLVRRRGLGGAQPVLFDFNKISYHLQPPNQLAALFVRLGLITPASRDRRYLRRLHRIDKQSP